MRENDTIPNAAVPHETSTVKDFQRIATPKTLKETLHNSSAPLPGLFPAYPEGHAYCVIPPPSAMARTHLCSVSLKFARLLPVIGRFGNEVPHRGVKAFDTPMNFQKRKM